MPGSLPALVQSVVAGCDTGADTNAPTYTITLPNPAGANNCIALCFIFNNAGTRALAATPVTDNNGGNTWNVGFAPFGSGLVMACYYALGVAAGTQVIQIAFTGDPSATDGFWCSASEWSGVQTSGAIRGSGSHPNGYFGSPISITPSTAPQLGDLVLQWGARDVNNNLNTYTSITADTNFNLVHAQLTVGAALQYSNNTTASTCTLTPAGNTGDSWNSCALVLKGSANAGTPAPTTGIRIVRTQSEIFVNTNTCPAIQFPCSGNLIAISLNTEDVHISSVTDDAGNVWDVLPVNANPPGGGTQFAWAQKASTSSTRTLTVTYTGGSSSSVSSMKIYDISGAADSPYDTSSTSTGNQATHGNLTTNTITPSQVGSVILNTVVVVWHTMTGLVADANGHTPTIDQQFSNKLDNASSGGTNESILDEDDGRAHLYNTDVLPVTFIYSNSATGVSSPDGVSQWASFSIVFKPAIPPGNVGVEESFESGMVVVGQPKNNVRVFS